MNERRMSASALESLAPGVLRPEHGRSATSTIVHLGVGAFSRAHLGVYADDLCALGHPAMVRGVSLRSSGAENQLAPQDGLYTVLEREPERGPVLRVVGSLHSVATGVDAAVHAIADPRTELITLTVTEKAYGADPGEPESVAHVLATGLAGRLTTGAPPIVASLDNVSDNGAVLRDAVLDAARHIDPALGDRIATDVAFPCSVVDRIVPATTARDLAEVEARLGVVDEAAVVAEHHRSWVISAVPGLPALAEVGVEVVDDIEPYQRRKLWLLNGPHSALAYLGLLAGCVTIAEAAADPRVAPLVRDLVDDVLAVAELPRATRPDAFAVETLHRFRNPDLGHTCLQVGADGSKKLPQRLLPVAALAEQVGRPTETIALVVAAWIATVAGIPVDGRTAPRPDDPLTQVLGDDPADLQSLVDRAIGTDSSPGFAARVLEQLTSLRENGLPRR